MFFCFVDLDMVFSDNTYNIIKLVKDKLGFCILALIDSDLKNNKDIEEVVDTGASYVVLGIYFENLLKVIGVNVNEENHINYKRNFNRYLFWR